MSKWYRRAQVISTVVVLFPCAGLLYASYLSATRPNHSRGEAIFLFILGVGLAPAIYFAYEGILWLKRGQQPDADPTSLAARLGKKAWLPLVPVAVLVGLASATSGFNQGFRHAREPDDLRDSNRMLANMRKGCVSSATETLKRRGGDVNAPPLKAKIDAYCGCFAEGMRAQYSLAELVKFDESEADLAKETKVRTLIERCQQQAAGE